MEEYTLVTSDTGCSGVLSAIQDGSLGTYDGSARPSGDPEYC